jgi:aspartate/methionine/tyrosine aminotransferase
MWMKRKIAQSKPGLANLAISGVGTEFANRWQNDVLTRRAAEIIERSGEPNQFGLESLKRAIRAAYDLPPRCEIATALGASGGYRLVCEMLLAGRPGAELVIEAPVYEPLRRIPERMGAKLTFAGVSGEVAEFARLVTDRTVAIVLTNLQNPTGHWLDYPQLRGLVDALRAIGSSAHVVVDETFLDIGPQPGTTAAGVDPRMITISSLSKSHGLPALRCGWVTADPVAVPNFMDDAVLFQNIGGKLAEVLGAMAIEEISSFRQAATEHLAANRGLMAAWMRDMADAEVVEPQDLPAGCIVFPRLKTDGRTDVLVEKLDAQFDVLVAPGCFFGDGNDDRIRIGFGGNRENLERGLARLAEGLTALCRS